MQRAYRIERKEWRREKEDVRDFTAVQAAAPPTSVRASSCRIYKGIQRPQAMSRKKVSTQKFFRSLKSCSIKTDILLLQGEIRKAKKCRFLTP